MGDLIVFVITLFTFMTIFLVSVGINYFKERHKDTIDITQIQYTEDFSPAKVEQERRQMMQTHQQQMEDYKRSQQSSQSTQEQQRRLMEDQRRQMEDLRRQSQTGR